MYNGKILHKYTNIIHASINSLSVCLLLFHTETARRNWVKFRIQIAYYTYNFGSGSVT